MKSRVLILILIALVVSSITLVPNPANALQCIISPFTESFVRYDLLLHGTLTEKHPSNQRVWGGSLTILTFDTINVYKDEYRDTFVIKADLTFDDFYRVGEDYVLFADKDDGDDYLRDLCVPDYVPTKKMTDFLDDYLSNPLIGIGVNQLYDVVGFPEMYSLNIKRQNYIELNRGDLILEQIKQDGLKNNDTCDFTYDFENSSESLSHNTFVNRFIEEHSKYNSAGFSYLSTNPQTAKITYVAEDEILEVSVMNAEVIGNCFFVYNLKIIDKNTNEVQINRDSQEKICLAENSHELFPDFCPNKVQKFPKLTEDNNFTINYGHQWILKIILIVIILITMPVGIIFGVKIWRKRR